MFNTNLTTYRISIYSTSNKKNQFGANDKSYVIKYENIYASISYKNQTQSFDNSMIINSNTIEVFIRHYFNIDYSDRILFDGYYYDIEAIEKINRAQIKLIAKRQEKN